MGQQLLSLVSSGLAVGRLQNPRHKYALQYLYAALAIIDQAQQFGPIERLEQVMVAAGFARQPAVLRACETAYANQQRLVHPGKPAQVLCEFKAVAAWHHHIKKHDLQDAKKRTMINADEKLLAVFSGKKQVSMFEMTKLVGAHLKK